MEGCWVKDYCPFAKDQGMLGVMGNVEQGQTIFGFSVTLVGAADALVFHTVTNGRVTEMSAIDYHVFVNGATESTSSPGVPAVVAWVNLKTKLGLTLHGDTGFSYDVVVQGKVKS